MMERRLLSHSHSLRLLHILHAAFFLRLYHQWPPLALSERALLILLRNITRRTTACTQTIFTSIALKVVLGAHIAAVEHGHDEGYADAGEAAETHAAEVTARVAVHVAIVLDAVMGATHHDAGTPP